MFIRLTYCIVPPASLILILAGLLYLSLLFPVTALAVSGLSPQQTSSISGSITKDTTWQGTVLVDGVTTVDAGVTVTILPGTRVKFKSYRGYREPEKRLSMIVKGALLAEGTAQKPIYFTSDASDPQNGDWSMLRLFASSLQSRFRYVVFECAQHGLNVWKDDPMLAHCVFRWNNWEGIYFESYCDATLDTCLILENGYNGLAAEQFNDLTLRYCEVKRNGTSGVHCDASTITVQDSWILENGAHGLSVDDNGSMTALGDLIADNGAWGIGVGEGINTVNVGNARFSGNKSGVIEGTYTVVSYPLDPPNSVSVGFGPDSSYALGYTPGDTLLDQYQYVYPDDETRQVVAKIGKGLGLTWSVAWDGSAIWTATLSGKIYRLNPVTGAILKQFNAPGSQPWGMTFDGKSLWLVDFAEKRISKIDTASGTELKTFATPDPAGGCKGVAWDGKYLNILGWTSAVIYRVDTSGSLAGTIALQQGGNGGIAWDGTHFWVSGRKILKYDTSGAVVGWIYPCSEGTWDMDWDGTHLWITQRTNENWRDAKLYRVAVLDDHSLPVTMYVKTSGNDLLSGLSAATAKKHIQTAIDVAPPKAVLRVAEGIYDENVVILGQTLSVEGGYDSIGWSRDANLHPVILTGGGRGPVIRVASGVVALEDLIIRDGSAGAQGGGGLDVTGGNTQLTRCVITHNMAIGQYEWGGGALTVLDGVLSMAGCRVVGNVSPGGAGGLRFGAGSRFTISGTIIAGNSGTPAVHINNASGTFVNCTVADNSAGGFLVNNPSQNDTLVNCVLWNNGPYDIAGYAPAVTYSDIQRGVEGAGNISSNPLFVDSPMQDYHLLSGSPCIDRGSPASPHDADGSRADMGAFFFDHNAAGVDGPSDGGIPAFYCLRQNFPNPFNPKTVLSYQLPVASDVWLSVYDLLGREVAVLVNERKAPGSYMVQLDASGLSSGVYLYRLAAGAFVHTRKMILVK